MSSLGNLFFFFEFYRSFKTDHTFSSYLDLTRGIAGRRASVKLRICNRKLMIIGIALFVDAIQGLNVINDPKSNKVLNVITFCPECNKLVRVIFCKIRTSA